MAKKLTNTTIKLGIGTLLPEAALGGLIHGALPAGDVNTVAYWNNVHTGLWLSNGNQTNSKGAWGIVLVLKTTPIPSSKQDITRILWFPQGTPPPRFYVGTFNDGSSSISWYQV